MKKIIFLFILSLSSLVWGMDYFTLDSEKLEENYLPSLLIEGKEGNLFILERRNFQVIKVDKKGNIAKKRALKGFGPGEISRGDGAYINNTYDNDGYYLTEFFNGNRRINFYNYEGEFKSDIKVKYPLNKGLLKSMPFKNKGFLAQFLIYQEAEKQGNRFLMKTPFSLSFLDSSGSIKKDILKEGFISRISKLKNSADVAIPFAPLFSWGYSKANNCIYYTNGKKNEITQLDLNGEIIAIIKLPFIKKERVTREDLKKWRKEYLGSISNQNWLRKVTPLVKIIATLFTNLKIVSLTFP